MLFNSQKILTNENCLFAPLGQSSTLRFNILTTFILLNQSVFFGYFPGLDTKAYYLFIKDISLRNTETIKCLLIKGKSLAPFL